jgi:hypothetical protein
MKTGDKVWVWVDDEKAWVPAILGDYVPPGGVWSGWYMHFEVGGRSIVPMDESEFISDEEHAKHILAT